MWYNTGTTLFHSYEIDTVNVSVTSLVATFARDVNKKYKDGITMDKGLALLRKHGMDGFKCHNIHLDGLSDTELLKRLKIVHLECVNCTISNVSCFAKIPPTLRDLKIIGLDTWFEGDFRYPFSEGADKKSLDGHRKAFWSLLQSLVDLKRLELTDGWRNRGDPGFYLPEVREAFQTIVSRLERLNMSARLLSFLWDYPDLLRSALAKHDQKYLGNTTSWCPEARRAAFTPADVELFESLLVKGNDLHLELDHAFDLHMYKRLCERKEGWREIWIRTFAADVPLLKNVAHLHFWQASPDFIKWLCDSIRANDPRLVKITTGFNALTREQHDAIQEALKGNTHIVVAQCRFDVKDDDDDETRAKNKRKTDTTKDEEDERRVKSPRVENESE